MAFPVMLDVALFAFSTGYLVIRAKMALHRMELDVKKRLMHLERMERQLADEMRGGKPHLRLVRTEEDEEW